MVRLVKFVTVLLGLFLVCGCNKSGMDTASDVSLVTLVAPGVLLSGPSFEPSDSALGDLNPPSQTVISGSQVALVHNPEPATLILWGAGLVGAAFFRRKKKI